MNRFIRYRLLTIVILGVLTSAMSVVALVQLLTTQMAQRVERARDAVVDEVDRVAATPTQLSEPTPTSIVALRAGIWTFDRPPTALPSPFVQPVRAAIAAARASGGRITIASPADEGTTIVSARPVIDPVAKGLPADAVAFGVYVVRPMQSVHTWQRIVAILALLTVLLVATAVYSVVTVNRGAAAIRSSLEALASDLNAKVPRPSVRELDAIADGIAELARKLAEARTKEDELARELAQNERLAALGRVAAGVAHEVRNPLASIKLRLDLAAATKPGLSEAAEKAVAHATSEIERLDRLVADLLVVAGRAVGPKGQADVGELVRARANGIAPWAAERSVKLAIAGDGEAVIDRDSTARAIDNLLRNAIEASPAGSEVKARVETADGRVLVHVEDRGPGVASDRTHELFEPFFTTKPAGTGLGLAISRSIARAHGGDVVYEREGKVSRFTIALPAVKSARAAA